MKRSEIINLVIDIIREARYDEEKSHEFYSEQILTALEEYGMLPPCRECKEDPSEFYCNQEPGEEHQLKWEDEDEEK